MTITFDTDNISLMDAKVIRELLPQEPVPPFMKSTTQEKNIIALLMALQDPEYGKIKTIKAVREMTNMGLTDAKRFVEQYVPAFQVK